MVPPKYNKSLKYIELVLIMAGSTASIAMELFIGPENHQPLDPTDGTIPSNHLHNFEHSSISMTFFTYAAFAILLDQTHAHLQHALTQLLGSIAFGQQLLLFHLHSADQMGPEGQYHLLLQLLVLVSLSTTLLGIPWPNSFLLNYVRSLSILFQGLWLIVMGFMLWTPGLVAKGCFVNDDEDGHMVVRCSMHEALHRANSLVNILFGNGWLVIAVTVFAVTFYLVLVRVYGEEKVEYFSLGDIEEEESSDGVDQKRIGDTRGNTGRSFIHVGRQSFSRLDMERQQSDTLSDLKYKKKNICI